MIVRKTQNVLRSLSMDSLSHTKNTKRIVDFTLITGKHVGIHSGYAVVILDFRSSKDFSYLYQWSEWPRWWTTCPIDLPVKWFFKELLKFLKNPVIVNWETVLVGRGDFCITKNEAMRHWSINKLLLTESIDITCWYKELKNIGMRVG